MEESEDSNSKVKFLVDTQGVCLFCFNEIMNSTSRRQPDLSYSSAQFSVLTRYLQIDLHKVLNLPDTFQIQNAVVSLKNSELAVALCSGCTTVIDKFSKLYRQLQQTQQQLNTTVEQIHNLIVGTERDLKRKKDYQKRFKSNKVTPEIIQSSIVDKLRKDMIEKCSGKISNSGPPQAKLERVSEIVTAYSDNQQIIFAQPQQQQLSTTTNFSSPSVSIPVQQISQPQPQPPQPAPTPQPPPPQPPTKSSSKSSGGSISNSFNTVQKIVTPNGETRFQCTHCKELFSDRAASRLHMVRFHCEQYFLSLKPPGLHALQPFKDAVESLFERIGTVDQGRRQKVLNRCPYCTDRTFTRKINVRAHMLDSHYEALVENLKQLLSKNKKKKGAGNTSVSSTDDGSHLSTSTSPGTTVSKSKVNSNRSVSATPPKHTCSRCGLNLPSKAKWLKHTKYHCKANGTKAPATTTTVTTQQQGFTFAGNPIYRTCDCGANLGSPKSWQNHQKIYCKLRKPTTINNTNLTNSVNVNTIAATTTTATFYANNKASSSSALIGGEQMILVKNDNVAYVTEMLPVPVKCLLEEHTYASDNHAQVIETEETTWIAVAEDPNQPGATIQMTYEDATDDGTNNVTVLATGHILQS